MTLLMFLADLMTEAIDDLHQHGAGAVPDLYDRFLGWAHRATARPLTTSVAENPSTGRHHPAADQFCGHRQHPTC